MALLEMGSAEAQRLVPKEWRDEVARHEARGGTDYAHAIQAMATIALAAEKMRGHHECDVMEGCMSDQVTSIRLLTMTLLRLQPKWSEFFHVDLAALIGIGIKLMVERALEEEAMDRQTATTGEKLH